MNFSEYQTEARKTAVYPMTHAINYPALGLASEAGEVAGKVKKRMRDGVLDHDAVAKEIGDVLWYCAMLATDLGLSLNGIAQANIEKLSSRKERGTLQGSGDDR